MSEHDSFIRVAALLHEALGISRVKVIFREGGHDNHGGQEAAYFMERANYREIPLSQTATLADYKAIAEREGQTIDEAQDRNIYSVL